MSFCLQPPLSRAPSSYISSGKTVRILATAETLRKAMTDAYWMDFLSEVCEGKEIGVVVRPTGPHIAFVTFHPSKLSPSGHQYPLSVSIPDEFLVPSSPVDNESFRTRRTLTLGEIGALHSSTYPSESDDSSTNGREISPKLCVVCGRYDLPDMLKRKKGWKCKGCKGTPSHSRLIEEAKKLVPILSHSEGDEWNMKKKI